jgi:hypothetical protein
MIIALPVHTAVYSALAVGAPVVDVAVHVSAAGSYRPPVFKSVPLFPPQTIIRVPVHTAVWSSLPAGAPVVDVAVQVSVVGSYRPPVFE